MKINSLHLLRSIYHNSRFLMLLFFCTFFMLRTSGIATGEEAKPSKDYFDSVFTLEEITVTASKREAKLMETPISVSAFTSERIDTQGIRSIDDISRLTPGINFVRNDTRNPIASDISIRGVSSTVASSTTGIYLDDTPIQTRIIGAGMSAYNIYPVVFDLERVEVLRGPQGTLFGSGSEGGTIRYITPKPSLADFHMYARTEVGFIDHGGETYEAGAAIDGPIVEDKLGLRVSAFYRHEGGYIDRVNTDPTPTEAPLFTFDLDPTTPATIIPARQTAKYAVEENANYLDRKVVRGALRFTPNDNLEILASVYYQDFSANDTSTYWETLSNPNDGILAQGNAIRQPSNDTFWIPALTITWDLGPVRLFSSTSYFDRKQSSINDYGTFESAIWAGYWEYPVGMFAPTLHVNNQEGWTQELRMESIDKDSPLQWVLGVFYQKSKQLSLEKVEDQFLPNLFADVVGVPFAAVFGTGLSEGLYTFNQDPVTSEDKQWAGFFQADYHVTKKLTFTGGVRYTEAEFSSTAKYNGPVVGPVGVDDSGSAKESPVTPKYGLSYQMTDTSLIYATAAKGFRIGGYNPQIGIPCTQACMNLGYVPTSDNPTGRPTLFESDTLWSYEFGTKNTIWNGRATISASVYYIDWQNIQQGVVFGNCGFGFTINAGAAEIKGGDLEVSYLATNRLRLGISFGYNDAEFKDTVFGGPTATVPLVSAGDKIPGPPWTLTLNAQYNFFPFDTYSFIRFDYEYQAEGPDDTYLLNLNNRNPALSPVDPYTFVPTPDRQNLNLRIGTQINDFNISLFVKNLLNEDTNLGRGDLAFNPVPYGTDPHGYTGQIVMPRSIGLTVAYRY